MQTTAEYKALQAIAAELQALPGHLGFYYINLVTGLEYGINADEAFLAASVIKLPLYLYILQQTAQGTMSMDEVLTVEEGDKVPICGALTLFTGPVSADLRTLCRLMISLSDNTATNKLIDRCGLPALAEGFAAMGLRQTVLRRKLFDRAASAAGVQNTISPREMGLLLQQLHREEFVSPAVCREALDTLLLQQVDHKLNGKLCGAVPVAHKTGEDDNLSNDVGIVYAPQPFVICFAGHDTDVYRWEDLMRRSTYELYRVQQEV